MHVKGPFFYFWCCHWNDLRVRSKMFQYLLTFFKDVYPFSTSSMGFFSCWFVHLQKLVNHTSRVNLHKDCKIILNIILAISDPNLLVMLNKVSFDVLKFWIHQSSFYYVDKILLVKTPKTKLHFTYSPNGLVQIPLQSSWLNLQVVQS